jgi:hypothetical protein
MTKQVSQFYFFMNLHTSATKAKTEASVGENFTIVLILSYQPTIASVEFTFL